MNERLTHPSSLGKNPRFARQTVVLSGLGLPEFQRCFDAILEIGAVIEDHLPSGNLRRQTPRLERGYPVLQLGNRYFADPADTGSADAVPMEVVDPLKILRNAVPDGVHTTDNEVLYFERQTILQDGKS